MADQQTEERLAAIEGKLADLDEAFYAQGEGGQEGQGGGEGSAGESTEGTPGEVGKEGNVTENFTNEITNNGEVESPLNETKLEKKGVITKKNLKKEAEKEGIGGGSKFGKWEEVGHELKTGEPFSPSAGDCYAAINIALQLAGKAGEHIQAAGNITIEGHEVANFNINLASFGGTTIFEAIEVVVPVPGGATLNLHTELTGEKPEVTALVASKMAS